MKEVIKPWGKEVWLELNDKYCLKILHINKKHRLSLQYHAKKKETMLVISGKAIFTLEQSDGKLQDIIFSEGHSITINPGQRHRVKALSNNVRIVEASTPEVDDIIRVNDDYDRID